MTKRGGLGRGLSALIPGATEAPAPAAPGGGLLQIPVEQLSANPRQPRTVFDDEPLDALAASIQEVGVLQPIVVRRVGSSYELIAGERRLRAAKRAGLATIPVVVRESGDADSLREALIENIHRENLNPIELAESFHTLLEELGLKQETLASRLGVSRSHIANTIRLLQLPAEVQSMLSDGRIQAGHGRALLGLGDAGMQRSLALRAAAEGLSVREVEDAVRGIVDAPKGATTPVGGTKAGDVPTGPGPLAELEEILAEQLATRVQIQMTKKRGRILIEFGSADDLERIVSEIVGSGPGLAPPG
ncbi:MAG: ParB/RepB/Spo0J family partition protein [Actinomycetota bacterium]